MNETDLIPLTLIGEAAGACIGDTCEVPAHPEQALINAAIDNDMV